MQDSSNITPDQGGQPPTGQRPPSCGPGRKLPTIPISTSGEGTGGKDSRGMGLLKGCQNGGYGPFFIEYTLMAEYQLVKKTKPSGIYVIPSARCPLVWNGVIFIRQGLYHGAVFRFTLHIPDNFPDGDCPSVVFTPAVFHPLIHPVTGQLDVQKAFEKWRRNYNRLWQVIHYIRKIFYKIETSSPSNPEAAVLYEQNIEVYRNLVTETIEKSKSQLYVDPDPTDAHAIRFSPSTDSVQLSENKSKMLRGKDGMQSSEDARTIETLGMSWMNPGSSEILSKQDLSSAAN